MQSPETLLLNLARLPLMTGPQALRHHFNGDVEAMRRMLQRLEATGFIRLTTRLVRGRQAAETPLLSLQAGSARPASGPIAVLARQRWAAGVDPILIINGTAKLALLHGGRQQALVTGHISHEVALVDVLLSKQRCDPSFDWIIVRSRPGAGAVPDAISASGCIEVIGQYSTTSISAKLSLAANFHLELW